MFLGIECVRWVLRNGGILEHPAWSRLWHTANLPLPGANRHGAGAWTLAIDQANFGHRISKPTWLLMSGIEPGAVDWDGFTLTMLNDLTQASLTPGQRSATPQRFAQWLVNTAAKSCRPSASGV